MREAASLHGPVDAVRLTIRYAGDRFDVVKRTPVRKSVRPSAPLLDDERETGFWLEVRSRGRSIYRQLLVNAIARDIEVFTTDEQRPMSRISVDDPVGTFTVVVPRMDADEVAIVGPPRTRPGRSARRGKGSDETAAVADLATFSLDDDGRSGTDDEPAGGAK